MTISIYTASIPVFKLMLTLSKKDFIGGFYQARLQHGISLTAAARS